MESEVFSPAPPVVDAERGGSVLPAAVRPRKAVEATLDWLRRRRLAVVGSTLAAIAAVAAACSPAYVMRAAVEEARFLWRRQPIAQVLRDPALDPDRRDKLAMVLRVREHAAEQLGLRVGGSFTAVSEVDKRAVVQLLTASRRDRLRSYTWWFPVVGSVPYKGFFSVDEAQAVKRSLEEQGYDTYLRPAIAFSTLGWFDDPLPSTLLRRSRAILAEVVFHELFHNTLFLPSQVTFNESAATFVGYRGAIEFFCREHPAGDDCREATDVWKDTLEMSRFVASAAGQLEDFYATNPGPAALERGRERLFRQIRSRFSELSLRTKHYAGFAAGTLNNASLLQERVYLRDLDLFEELYRQTGDLSRAVMALRRATDRSGDPFEQVARLLGQRRFELVSHPARAGV